MYAWSSYIYVWYIIYLSNSVNTGDFSIQDLWFTRGYKDSTDVFVQLVKDRYYVMICSLALVPEKMGYAGTLLPVDQI